MKISARNCLEGTVKSVRKGVVNSEVVLTIAPGVEITAVVTETSCSGLKLKKGKKAYAIIKASSVMLGVD